MVIVGILYRLTLLKSVFPNLPSMHVNQILSLTYVSKLTFLFSLALSFFGLNDFPNQFFDSHFLFSFFSSSASLCLQAWHLDRLMESVAQGSTLVTAPPPIPGNNRQRDRCPLTYPHPHTQLSPLPSQEAITTAILNSLSSTNEGPA